MRMVVTIALKLPTSSNTLKLSVIVLLWIFFIRSCFMLSGKKKLSAHFIPALHTI